LADQIKAVQDITARSRKAAQPPPSIFAFCLPTEIEWQAIEAELDEQLLSKRRRAQQW
jgi:hypothetical protein